MFKKLFGLFGWGKKAPKPTPIPLGRPKPIPQGQPGASSYPLPVAIPVITKPKPVARPRPITTGRKIEDERANREWYEKRGPYGTRTGAVQVLAPGSSFEEAFLNGTLNYVASSLVAWFQYNRRDQELTVGFLPHFYGGAVVIYSDVSEAEAGAAFRAASKGGWTLDELWGPRIPGSHRHVGLKPWRHA
jgi:hypothetical protein